MINTIPQILINGSPKIFGGYIYNARLSIAAGQGSSELTLSVISENGSYQISPGTISNPYCNPYTINLGSQISFSCYLEEYSETISPGGNTLSLRFVDTSNILDKIYVGLYKKHGIESKDNLILVGKEISPCSNEEYGSLVPKIYYDPCHPCINSEKQANESNWIDCVEKSKYEILDVKYNFGELISKIKIEMIGANDPNPKYLAQHTGLLRDVLSAWCRDFGWFFYWNNGKIVFKDLRNNINVGATIDNFCPNLLESTSTYSMRNSVKTATITNFSRPGDPARLYDCQEAKYIIASTLKQNTAGISIPLGLTSKIDTIAAGLGHYDQDLRDLYYWYEHYEMYDSKNYTAGKKLEKLGMTILSNQIKLGTLEESTKTLDDNPYPDRLYALNEKVTDISPFVKGNAGSLNSNVEKIKANKDFYNCVQLLDPETQWKVVDKPNAYFFFLAERNDTVYSKYAEEERDFAQIMNKYAVYVPSGDDLKFFEDYDFELEKMCGISKFVNTQTVSYNFTPSNVIFYNTSAKGDIAGEGTPMNDLPFSRFLSVLRGADSGSTSGTSLLGFKLILVERGENSFTPNDSRESGGNYPPIRTDALLNKAARYFPFQLANKNNLKGEFISRALKDAEVGSYNNSGDVYLYMSSVISADAFKITEVSPAYTTAATFGRLYDGKPLNKQLDLDSGTKKPKIIYQYPKLQCKIVGNHSFNSPYTLNTKQVIFHTPVADFDYKEPTDALYGIVVEKVKNKRRIIDKVESFYTSNLDGASCNYSKLVVNARNISDERLRVLKQNDTICEFDVDKIKQIHTDFSNSLAVSFTTPSVSKTFRIAGIEIPGGYVPSIDNGLIGLEIGLDSNNAVYSVYEFGTTLIKLPESEEFAIANSEMLSNPGSYTTTVNHFPTKGQPNV